MRSPLLALVLLLTGCASQSPYDCGYQDAAQWSSVFPSAELEQRLLEAVVLYRSDQGAPFQAFHNGMYWYTGPDDMYLLCVPPYRNWRDYSYKHGCFAERLVIKGSAARFSVIRDDSILCT